MEVLIAVVSMLLVLALFPLLLWRRRSIGQHEHEQEDQNEVPHPPVRQAGTRGRMRRRTVASTSSSAFTSEDVLDEDGEEEPEAEYYAPKSSKKKEMKRQEREAQRQAEEGAREIRRTKQDRYAEMRHQKDEQREAEERRKEEEARAQKAKEEEALNAEFEKWKDVFSVETEGTGEEMQDGGQGLLFDFVEYIKKNKCVFLEDLAAEFKLRTQDCINRILSLEKMGRLYGVMDDRGKYIYISLEEMKFVADYIKRQGRVSIAHLASKSNEFIDLEPKLNLDEVPADLNKDWKVNNESNAIAVA
uniref:DDRGK domain-containing protein 1 n=1 Tax=Wollemia nobilis TaxID=56998 RepID=A0A0C9RS64_9CONI